MNLLSQLISRLNLDELKVMNALQIEVGLISDLCVTAEDVADKDCSRACYWVEKNQKRFTK